MCVASADGGPEYIHWNFTLTLIDGAGTQNKHPARSANPVHSTPQHPSIPKNKSYFKIPVDGKTHENVHSMKMCSVVP